MRFYCQPPNPPFVYTYVIQRKETVSRVFDKTVDSLVLKRVMAFIAF